MNAAVQCPVAAPPLPTLLVDDDAFVRKVVARQLRALGVEHVVQAADGHAAQRLLRSSGPFRLIMIDLMMPGCDGVELLREIAVCQPGAALALLSSAEPRVLRTARQLAQARNLRVAGSFPKPISLQSLRALVQSLDLAPAPARVLEVEAPLTAAELGAALAQGELGVHVQPEIDLRNGTIHGVEVLARWHSPARGGFVRPDRFVALAEASGLIRELTEQVLRLALEAGRHWRSLGLDLHLAVNLSPRCLDDLRLPEHILGLADELSFDPRRLLLEVTESGFAGGSTPALDILTRLRLNGIELAIDDFGTGYSSLQQLQRIPFSQLKVDRSFVSRAVEDPDARHIDEANIRLAHGLGLRAVAEGIETPEQLALLRTLGCDLGQGYLLARPMPVHEFPGWARSFRLDGA
jgi:EAL domain-containing protein (putative c-di-GMP-specific phosphodiesterase class I)